MGFFDQFTANGFVTHLELAVKAVDVFSVTRHVSKAFDAMRKIERKGIQETLTYQGWKYVVHLSTQIGMFAASEHEERILRDIDWITKQAVKWRDEAYARETGQQDSN